MIHAIKVDDDIQDKINEFNDRIPDDLKIVHMAVSGDYLFLTVEKKELQRQNSVLNPMQLLHDQLKRGPTRT